MTTVPPRSRSRSRFVKWMLRTEEVLG